VLSGGCSDSTAIRAVLELGNWLKLSGEQFLRGTWAKVQNEIHAHGKGGTFITEKFRHDMPPCLANNEARSWVSGGWATPCGVRPLTAEAEQKIVQTLTAELNDMYNLGLDSDPNMNTVEKEKKIVKYLVIGGSHAKRGARFWWREATRSSPVQLEAGGQIRLQEKRWRSRWRLLCNS
jgi:hypothetical protein